MENEVSKEVNPMERIASAATALFFAGMVAMAPIAGLVELGRQVHTYGVPGHTLNGGVVVGDCYRFNVGFEAWGPERGFFVDQC